MFNFFKTKSSEPQTLFFHTDIHCHIVPGVDDGSPNLGRSVELARRMRGWGAITDYSLAACHTGHFREYTRDYRRAVRTAQTGLADNDIDIELSHSAEYRLDEFFLTQVAAGNLRPLPNNYLLVENSYIQEPWDIDKLLFDLNIKGYRPILAHPERYLYYHDKRQRYHELHTRGALFQVNVLSLAEHYGKAEKKMAEYLIENNLVDFLGTDLHSRHHAASIDAYLASKDYRKHRKALEGRILNDRAFIVKS